MNSITFSSMLPSGLSNKKLESKDANHHPSMSTIPNSKDTARTTDDKMAAEFDFVSMEVSKPNNNPRSSDPSLIKDNTEKREYSPPVIVPTQSILHSRAATNNTTATDDKLHVSFSTDLEDYHYQTSFDYPKDRSFDSATTASSHESNDSMAYSTDAAAAAAAATDVERPAASTSTSEVMHRTTYNNLPGDTTDDDTVASSNNNNNINPPSTPQRLKQKYHDAMREIRHQRRRHKHYFQQQKQHHHSNHSFCTSFLLFVGLASLVLVLLALIPHIILDVGTDTTVYHDSQGGNKDLVVSNQDFQWTLMVLALGLIVVLLLGSLCYCGSAAMGSSDEDDDNDDNNDNDRSNKNGSIVLADLSKERTGDSVATTLTQQHDKEDELLPK